MSFGKTTPTQAMPWGSQDMTLSEPFGNRLVLPMRSVFEAVRPMSARC
jgi:hypothetical protein